MLDQVIEFIGGAWEIAAVVVTAASTVVGYKQMKKEPKQRTTSSENDLVSDESNYVLSERETENDCLMVFSTKKQRTILRTTDRGLECQLFNFDPAKSSGTQWVLSKNACRKIIESNNYGAKSGFKSSTGRFFIGRYKNWLYSKKLFSSPKYFEKKLKVILEHIAEKKTDD